MRSIIVARHGSYTSKTGALTPFGSQQIERLAGFIREVSEGNFYFASSDRLRAFHTADILRNMLGEERHIETLDELCCEEDYMPKGQAEAIYNAVCNRQDKADNLILVSHYAVVQEYPAYLMQKEWGEEVKLRDIPKGRAVHLHLTDKTFRIIPPVR